jgi:hypothetical protein
MKKIFLALITIFTSLHSLHAQKTYGYAGFVKIGYSYTPGLPAVLNRFSPSDLSVSTNNLQIIGIESYVRLEQYVIALEGTVSADQTKRYEDGFAEPFMISGNVKLGKVIKERSNYWIYPSLGIGPSATIITIFKKHDGQTDIEENYFLLTPAIDLGFNADFIMPRLLLTDRSKGRVILGIRIGYQASFNHHTWRNDRLQLLNSIPAISNNIYYIHAAIGEGAFARRLKRL